MADTLIVPGAEPFFFPGGPTGCLLLHGFTAMPEEMRWLGEDLARRGHTVLGVRLAGHATDPHDLARTRWTDWLVSVEDGLAVLAGAAERVVLMGLSMGGAIALLAAARYPVAGVVAMAAPYQAGGGGSRWGLRLYSRLRPMLHKSVEEAAPPLDGRREANYPAYPRFPARIVVEMADMVDAMRAWLPQVTVPALLVQSRADEHVPPESAQAIYDRLGSSRKEILWLDDFEHAVVRDPKREAVFEAVARFVDGLGMGPS